MHRSALLCLPRCNAKRLLRGRLKRPVEKIAAEAKVQSPSDYRRRLSPGGHPRRRRRRHSPNRASAERR